ncbi:hypothetical protein COL87_12240 [Bacillus pseudomycoides]|nr:hypothetical protein CN641_15775 [Bacillus pseudomycoides]PGA71502.1 hypothetical protein COL87_12240 [Bacillus pseudomycoides]PHE23236.1 hypothetical protein COF59_00735 [Bacillus pseudomycoides]PHE95347.1 hypothetical protein COF78_12780 [Bacillus pseudomycoides]
MHRQSREWVVNMIALYAVRNSVSWDSIEVDRILETIHLADKVRILKFKKNEDKMRALLAVLLARYALATALQMPEGELIVERLENGRPFLKEPAEWKGDFNLTHSGEWVVCALNSAGRIGVDTEKIEEIDINLFKGVLTRTELEVLTGNKEDSIPTFFSLWSRKESFVKALGTGLSYPLEKVEFVPISDSDSYQVYLLGGSFITSWYCKDFYLDKRYSLAVCTDKLPFPESLNFLDASDLLSGQMSTSYGSINE